ncbi:hypothetical protein QBC34DRAFT_479913 [Podospora aff. communis PSN243]|uniref:Uncharacterized protein n=1 Tax=Podospora aff. communis PSN243 TaxID=3040156 RepID=A0AAV9G4E1_9PEZI|nr:hypothetical protein QBC34DRAFT_479913 [Podospora aff. communis PSN243]
MAGGKGNTEAPQQHTPKHRLVQRRLEDFWAKDTKRKSLIESEPGEAGGNPKRQRQALSSDEHEETPQGSSNLNLPEPPSPNRKEVVAAAHDEQDPKQSNQAHPQQQQQQQQPTTTSPNPPTPPNTPPPTTTPSSPPSTRPSPSCTTPSKRCTSSPQTLHILPLSSPPPPPSALPKAVAHLDTVCTAQRNHPFPHPFALSTLYCLPRFSNGGYATLFAPGCELLDYHTMPTGYCEELLRNLDADFEALGASLPGEEWHDWGERRGYCFPLSRAVAKEGEHHVLDTRRGEVLVFAGKAWVGRWDVAEWAEKKAQEFEELVWIPFPGQPLVDGREVEDAGRSPNEADVKVMAAVGFRPVRGGQLMDGWTEGTDVPVAWLRFMYRWFEWPHSFNRHAWFQVGRASERIGAEMMGGSEYKSFGIGAKTRFFASLSPEGLHMDKEMLPGGLLKWYQDLELGGPRKAVEPPIVDRMGHFLPEIEEHLGRRRRGNRKRRGTRWPSKWDPNMDRHAN